MASNLEEVNIDMREGYEEIVLDAVARVEASAKEN